MMQTDFCYIRGVTCNNRNPNINICLISGTHLTKKLHIGFNEYQIYHALHPPNSRRGIPSTIVKNNIIHYEREKYKNEKREREKH